MQIFLVELQSIIIHLAPQLAAGLCDTPKIPHLVFPAIRDSVGGEYWVILNVGNISNIFLYIIKCFECLIYHFKKDNCYLISSDF